MLVALLVVAGCGDGGDVRGAAQVVVFDCNTDDCNTDAMKPLGNLGAGWNDIPPIASGYGPVRAAILDRVSTLAMSLR